MNNNDWIDNLKAEYKCKDANFIPFPSASPQFFQGYRVVCGLTGKECDKRCEKK